MEDEISTESRQTEATTTMKGEKSTESLQTTEAETTTMHKIAVTSLL